MKSKRTFLTLGKRNFKAFVYNTGFIDNILTSVTMEPLEKRSIIATVLINLLKQVVLWMSVPSMKFQLKEVNKSVMTEYSPKFLVEVTKKSNPKNLRLTSIFYIY